MGELVKDQIELSQYEEKDVIKVQAFVRGYQGRARVSLMVQKWIDELLSRKKERENRGNSAKSNTSADISETEHSTSSIGLTEEAPADNKQDSDKKEEMKDNNQPTNPDQPPKTEEQKDSKEEEESQEKKDPEEQAPEKQKDTEEEKDSKPEEEKTSELTTKGRRNSIVKDFKFQSNATKHVTSSDQLIEEQMVRMNDEIQQLLKDIKRVGEPGEPSVEFGVLFDDEQVANYYEALVGTLKAAKKRGLIQYKGQYLMKGMNDKVVISIV